MAAQSSSPKHWANEWLFILAAVGAAAGLGNLWRFPYMVYENGGAAFIVAYLVCLLLIVIPMITTEVAFGQVLQRDLVAGLGRLAGYFGRFVGWMTVGVLILILGYYAAVVAWGVDYLFYSPTLAWGNDAETFFFERILQFSGEPGVFGGFSTPIVAGLVVAYAAVYLSIHKGITSVSRVIKWTVTLPFVLLAVLLINSFTLPGAFEGWQYLLVPDWSQLWTVSLWRSAVSQSLFSANIGLAATIFYAAFNQQQQDIFRSATFIAVGNATVSLLASFAIFGTLGWMAASQQVDISEVVASGPTLAFVAFPNALAALPVGSGFMATLFFMTVFTLAVDSAFALAEVAAGTIRSQFKAVWRLKHSTLIAITCVLCFVWSLSFAGGNGLLRLDVLDHYVVSHLIFWVVIPQVILIAWLTPLNNLREHSNTVSRWKLGTWFLPLVKFLAPITLISLYTFAVIEEYGVAYGGYPDWFLFQWGMLPLLITVVLSALLALKQHRDVHVAD